MLLQLFEWYMLVPLRPLSTTLLHQYAVREHDIRSEEWSLQISPLDRGLGNDWSVWPVYEHIYVRDCGGGGDCLFHCIAYALGTKTQTIRDWLSDCVNEDNVDQLLEYYANVYRVGDWGASEIRAKKDIAERVFRVREVMKRMGSGYQGDDTALKLLMLGRGLSFLIFSGTGEMYPHVFCCESSVQLILLKHVPGHWQLLGYAAPTDPYHRVITIFDPFGRLPPPIRHALSVQLGIDNMCSEFGEWKGQLALERSVA